MALSLPELRQRVAARLTKRDTRGELFQPEVNEAGVWREGLAECPESPAEPQSGSGPSNMKAGA